MDVNGMINSFEPIVDENCKVLILGTMPSVESLRKQEYYANKRNQFWKIVFSLIGRTIINNYEDKKNFLLMNHIAIWDVLYSCEREGSLDSNIKNTEPNDFNWLFMKYPSIKSIYFNGKTAEKLYRRLVDKNINNGVMFLTALPSTSPANAMKFEEKVREWQVILLSLKE
jgi:hypoxanthine-DNA glycosylase